jgi:hypothetical protein
VYLSDNKGTARDHAGTVFKGKFVSGKFTSGTITYPDGRVRTGSYDHRGRFNGEETDPRTGEVHRIRKGKKITARRTQKPPPPTIVPRTMPHPDFLKHVKEREIYCNMAAWTLSNWWHTCKQRRLPPSSPDNIKDIWPPTIPVKPPVNRKHMQLSRLHGYLRRKKFGKTKCTRAFHFFSGAYTAELEACLKEELRREGWSKPHEGTYIDWYCNVHKHDMLAHQPTRGKKSKYMRVKA